MSQFYDLEQEKTVISYALAHTENCNKALNDIGIDLLEDTRHQRIWEAMQHYYQQYGGVLDRNGLQVLLGQNNVPQDKQIMYLTLIDDIKARVVMEDAYKAAIDVLENLRFKRGLYDMINSASGYLEHGTVDKTKVCNEIVSSILSLQSTKGLVSRETSFKKDYKQRVEAYKDRQANPNKYKGVPYGLKKLDELTGGVMPGELSLIFGRPGAGKSESLHNIAYNAAMRGYRSLYITIEMPKDQVGRRLDSRNLQISARGLRNAALNAVDEKKFFSLMKKGIDMPGDIMIVDMPQGCSVAQLLPLLRRYRMRNKMDLLLIDYLNLMEPTKWSYSKVERVGMVGNELKKLARRESIPVITAARATRDAAKVESEDVGTEHLSWADDLGYDADQIIYLKKGKNITALEAVIEAVVVKFRDGSNETFKIGVDWDRSFMGDMEEVLSRTNAKLQL